MSLSDTQATIDPLLFRQVMGRFTTGVTVITTDFEGGVRGMTANAFMSGSLVPPLCVISVARRARMHAVLAKATHFGVNILAQGQEDISLHFAGRPDEGLQLCFEYMSHVPVLVGTSAAIATEIAAHHECGDHTLFIGHILEMRDEGRAPLVYHGGRYATLEYPEQPAPYPLIEFW